MRRGRPPHTDILTPREWEVLYLLEQGFTNPQIARHLGITEGGAKYHVSEIITKLGAENRFDAVRWAREGRSAKSPAGFTWPEPLSLKLSTGFVAVTILLVAVTVPIYLLSGSEAGSDVNQTQSEEAVFDGQSAEDFLAAVSQTTKAQEGQVLYYVVEVYQRYGPKADEIMALPQEPGTHSEGTPLPEHHIQETWAEIASPEAIRQQRVVLRDLSGEILADRVTSPAKVDSGEVIPVNAPTERVQVLQEQLRQGTARPIYQSADIIILESRHAWERHLVGDVAISIPYVEDLSPVEWITRITLRSDGLLVDGRDFVLTADGEKVLVRYRKTTFFEILDRAPFGIFEGTTPVLREAVQGREASRKESVGCQTLRLRSTSPSSC